MRQFPIILEYCEEGELHHGWWGRNYRFDVLLHGESLLAISLFSTTGTDLARFIFLKKINDSYVPESARRFWMKPWYFKFTAWCINCWQSSDRCLHTDHEWKICCSADSSCNDIDKDLLTPLGTAINLPKYIQPLYDSQHSVNLPSLAKWLSSLHLHVTFYQLSTKKQRINSETNRQMGLPLKESHHYPTTRYI